MCDHEEDIYVEVCHLERHRLIFPLNQLLSSHVGNTHLQY